MGIFMVKTTPARDKVFHFIRSFSVRGTPPLKGGETYTSQYMYITIIMFYLGGRL
jgi:hypothetical protein